MTNCVEQFEAFIDRISLKQRHVDRIETATGSLSRHLIKKLALEDSDIFAQGSYANCTAIRPPTGGAYDVDLIVRSASSNSTAKGALDALHEALSDHGTYADRLEPKTPCIRVNYADDDIGSFHVDVVPVRDSDQWDAPLDAPRRNAGWHATAPAEFTEWCGSLGDQFTRTVKTLKRWRNEQQDIEKAIKSIQLQVLTSQHMPNWVSDDGQRLTQTLESMNTALSQLDAVPTIANPVLVSEDLAARWTWGHFQDFRAVLKDAAVSARAALDEPDPVTSAQMWKELLGEHFPLPSAEASGVELSDLSHRLALSTKSWSDITENYRESFKVQAKVLSWNRRRVTDPNYTGGALKAGWRIKFEAKYEPAEDVTIWWQVTNSGEHAASKFCLRGDFQLGSGPEGTPSKDGRINWETTEYTGSHLVQAFAVDRLGLVLAKSEPLRIDVRNPAWRLRR